MAASHDSLLYSCIIGTVDDPIPALQARLCALDAASPEANAIRGAINALSDAEIDILLLARGNLPTDRAFDAATLQTRHAQAIDAARDLLIAEALV